MASVDLDLYGQQRSRDIEKVNKPGSVDEKWALQLFLVFILYFGNGRKRFHNHCRFACKMKTECATKTGGIVVR